MVSNERTVTPPCDECGHTHALAGCVGPPTPSDLWAGVTPGACDCKRLADAGTTQGAPEPSQAAIESHGDDERVRRYRDAVENAVLPVRVRQVMAVADAEQAELRAEIEQVRLGARTLGEIIRRQGRDVLDATGLHHLIDEDGDGDWGLVWEHLAELRPRAGAAESKVARAAEVLDPLIEGVEMDDSGEPTCHDYDRIDNGECALLADLRRVKAALDGDA